MANLITLTESSDSGTGSNGDDIIYALGGDDTIEGARGYDTIHGGAGNDYLYAYLFRSGDLFNDAINWLYGEAGDDQLFGSLGPDHLDGGSGSDRMWGYGGGDIYTIDSTSDLAYDSEGDDWAYSTASWSMGDGIDRLYLTGGSGTYLYGYGNILNNQIYGSAGPNYLWGGDGNDRLDGGAGNDTLDGWEGIDSMSGGRGNDVYFVDRVGEVARENAGEGKDYVYSYLGVYTLPQNVEVLYLDATANQSGAGNGLANEIYGNYYSNTLDGKAGSDILDGSSGSDTLLGGDGNDTLLGRFGQDKLRGQAGDDVLQGGADADTLVGGAGRDRFDFADVGESQPGARDVIQSGDGNSRAFDAAGSAEGDRIGLVAIDADVTRANDQKFVFGGTGRGHLSLTNSGSDTVVHGNVDDDATFEFELVIQDGNTLASAYRAVDFIL